MNAHDPFDFVALLMLLSVGALALIAFSLVAQAIMPSVMRFVEGL